MTIKPAVGWGLVNAKTNRLHLFVSKSRWTVPDYKPVRLALVPLAAAKKAGLVKGKP